MPYLPPDQQKRQPWEQGPVQQPTTAAGGGAPASSAPASPAAPTSPSMDTGSGWTNLQDYLSANRPALQAEGAQAAADLTGKAQSALTTANGTALYGAPQASGALTPNTAQWANPSANPLFTDANKKAAGEALQGVQDYTAPTGGMDAWLRGSSGATGQVQAVGDKYGDALRAVQGYEWNKATPPVPPAPAEGAGNAPVLTGQPATTAMNPGSTQGTPYTSAPVDQGGHSNQPTSGWALPPQNDPDHPTVTSHERGDGPPAVPYPNKAPRPKVNPGPPGLRSWMGGR